MGVGIIQYVSHLHYFQSQHLTSLAFQDLQQGSWMSEYEIAILRNQLGSFRTIALLCPSSVDFLFSWLRLLRAGYSVLIIA